MLYDILAQDSKRLAFGVFVLHQALTTMAGMITESKSSCPNHITFPPPFRYMEATCHVKVFNYSISN